MVEKGLLKIGSDGWKKSNSGGVHMSEECYLNENIFFSIQYKSQTFTIIYNFFEFYVFFFFVRFIIIIIIIIILPFESILKFTAPIRY